MTDAEARSKRLAYAALIASDHAHDRLPFAQAELAARWALEAWVKGWAHVPGSQAAPEGASWDEVPLSLAVAEEALELIRTRVAQAILEEAQPHGPYLVGRRPDAGEEVRPSGTPDELNARIMRLLDEAERTEAGPRLDEIMDEVEKLDAELEYAERVAR